VEVRALYVFRGVSGSVENLINLSMLFGATHLSGDGARPAASVLPRHKALLMQEVAWEDCARLFTPSGSEGGFGWLPLSRRVWLGSRMCPLFSPISLQQRSRNASDVAERWHFQWQQPRGSDQASVELHSSEMAVSTVFS